MTRREVGLKLGGICGGVRLLTHRACAEVRPDTGIRTMRCDLPRGHLGWHTARWWAEYGWHWRRFPRYHWEKLREMVR